MAMSFVSVFMAAKCLTEFYRNGSLFLPPRPRGLRSLAFIVLFSPLLLIYNRLFSDSECFLSLNYSPVFCAQTVINWSCWCFAIVPGVLMRLFLFRGFTVETQNVFNLQWECEYVAQITQINYNIMTTKYSSLQNLNAANSPRRPYLQQIRC